MVEHVPVDVKIDEGVPIPVQRISVPLDTLEVGQSVEFPIAKRSSVQSLASRLKKSTGKTFTVRTVDEEKARVWRTK